MGRCIRFRWGKIESSRCTGVRHPCRSIEHLQEGGSGRLQSFPERFFPSPVVGHYYRKPGANRSGTRGKTFTFCRFLSTQALCGSVFFRVFPTGDQSRFQSLGLQALIRLQPPFGKSRRKANAGCNSLPITTIV